MGGYCGISYKEIYSGYCSYEVDARDKDEAFEKVKEMPIDYDEVLGTLEDWEECNEVEPIKD